MESIFRLKESKTEHIKMRAKKKKEEALVLLKGVTKIKKTII